MKHLFCYCILLTAMALMLGSCARRQSHQAVWMRQQLMQLKADDQADTLHTDTTLARRLVYYYEHEGDKTLLPEAYYYAGRIFYDRGDMPEALSLYQRAADVLSSQSSPDNHLASVCYSQMGYVFMYQDLFEEGEDMFRHAIRYAELARDTSDLSYCWRDLATVYEMNKQYDKELHCLQKAKRFAEQANDTVSLLVIESYLANHYYHTEDYQRALSCLTRPLSNIQLLDSSAVYQTAANIYFKMGQTDSALYYMHLVERFGRVYAKKKTYLQLLIISLQNKDVLAAQQHFVNYQNYADSVKRITQPNDLVRLQNLYLLNKQAKHNRLWTSLPIILLAVLLAIILVFVLVYVRLIRRTKTMEPVTNLNDKILSSFIYLFFKDVSVNSKPLPAESDWNCLQDMLNEYDSHFMKRLLGLEYRLNEQELRVSMLIRLRFDPKAIAYLTAHHISSISTTRSRLFEKVFHRKGSASDWDKFIWSI